MCLNHVKPLLLLFLLIAPARAGSGQQSVTGVENADDANSYWQIRGKPNQPCQRGVAIKCGQSVRITHMKTGRNLHSHHFTSPLSNNQVSTVATSWVLFAVLTVEWVMFGDVLCLWTQVSCMSKLCLPSSLLVYLEVRGVKLNTKTAFRQIKAVNICIFFT